MILLSLYCSFLSSAPSSPFVFSHPYGIFVCLKEKCHFEERSFQVRVWKRAMIDHIVMMVVWGQDGCSSNITSHHMTP